MLCIRPEQVAALAAAMTAAFVRDAMQQLRTRFPSHVEALDDEELRRRVGASLAAARDLGFTQQRDLLTFVTLTFVIAPRFYEHPAIAEILESAILARDDRLNAVVNALRGGLGAVIRNTAS